MYLNCCVSRTAEHVSNGHPDKFCDQVADRILDEVLMLAGNDREIRRSARTAIECLAKDNLLVVSGEVKLPDEIRARLDVTGLAREVWKMIGYGTDASNLTVIDHVQTQSADIALKTDEQGAGDQGIMVGYATNETPEMMPREWMLARDLCMKLRDLRISGELSWLRSDCKSQVTVAPGGRVTSVIIAAQHADDVSDEEIQAEILCRVVLPVLENVDPHCMKINGTGRFVIGGPTGDAGVVGRKVAVDAYGPRVPVGGGAYSGKDPTKVDRSAAYMARHIAKAVVAEGVKGAKECLVTLAYGIGQFQPEMITAVTEAGIDVSAWVKKRFPDLSPAHIIDRLGLLERDGWTYFETASFGHYGRGHFPWEKVGS